MKQYKILILALGLIFGSLLEANIQKSKSAYVQTLKKEALHDLYSYPASVVSKKESFALATSIGVVEEINKTLGEAIEKNEIIASVRHSDPAYNYKTMHVRSPIKGVMAQFFVKTGTAVSAGEKIGLIIDKEEIKLIAEITLKDMNIIAPHSQATVQIPGSASNVEAIVTGIAPMVDPATGTATIWLDLKGPHTLLPGTITSITFRVNEREAIKIPADALVYLGRNTYVRTVDENNVVNKTQVQYKTNSSGVVEILDGLSENQRIVTRSSGFLADGSTIEVKEAQK